MKNNNDIKEGEFKGTVYCIINIINFKKYIGITSNNLRDRIMGHIREAKKGNKKLLYKAIRKYGSDSFCCKILEQNINNENSLYMREIYWIDFYKTTNKKIGYNISEGGRNPRMKGNNHPLFNVGHSEQSCLLISENHADCSGKNNSRYVQINLNDLIIDLLSINPYFFRKDLKEKYPLTPERLLSRVKEYNVDLFNFIKKYRKKFSYSHKFSTKRKEGHKITCETNRRNKEKNNIVLNHLEIRNIKYDFCNKLPMKMFEIKYKILYKKIYATFKKYLPELITERKNKKGIKNYVLNY